MTAMVLTGGCGGPTRGWKLAGSRSHSDLHVSAFLGRRFDERGSGTMRGAAVPILYYDPDLENRNTILAAFVYVITIGGTISCFDWTSRWDLAMVTDFSIYAVVLGAWYFYKESSWIKTAIFFVLLQTIGSVATIPYILFQFYKLSPEESATDPFYFVLARHQKREYTQGTSVATARIIFSALGCLMVVVLIYTFIMDIYFYHGEAFSMCFLTYMVDIYIHVVLLSVWIAYKESSWISASLWILSLVVLGSITLCVYIVRELLFLSRDQPASLIIFKTNHRDMQSTDPLLMPQAIV